MSFNSHNSEETHEFVANEAGIEAEENGQDQPSTNSIQKLGLRQKNQDQYSKRCYSELGSREGYCALCHDSIHDRIDLDHATAY